MDRKMVTFSLVVEDMRRTITSAVIDHEGVIAEHIKFAVDRYINGGGIHEDIAKAVANEVPHQVRMMVGQAVGDAMRTKEARDALAEMVRKKLLAQLGGE